MSRVILDSYAAQYIYEYSFNELLNNVPYNPDDEKVRIELIHYPILLIRLSRQLRNICTCTECHIQATRLGCAKLQHDKRIIELIKKTESIIDNGHIFAVHDLLSISGYPYATDVIGGRFKISVLTWVNSYIDINSVSLGLSKGQMAAMCFLIGVSDYTELNDNRSKEIKLELAKFWNFIEYKLKQGG